jgi:hypothetical protein
MMTGTSGRAALAFGNSSRPVIPGMLMSERIRINARSYGSNSPLLDAFTALKLARRRAWFSHRMKGAAAVQGIAPLKHHVNQSARPEWPVNLYPRTEYSAAG